MGNENVVAYCIGKRIQKSIVLLLNRCFAFYKKKRLPTRKSVSWIGDSDPEVLSFGLFIEVFNTFIHSPFPTESRDAVRCWVAAQLLVMRVLGNG